MIPYVPAPSLHIGSWRMPVFGLLMVSGILTGRAILVRRARRFGISDAEIVPLYLAMLAAGIAGAVLAQWIAVPAARAAGVAPGLSSIGGLAAGVAGGIVMCVIRRYSFARSLFVFDIIAFAVPFASCVARLGCALAHDHRGLPSFSWLSVRFPEGPRWDLGLLEFLFLAGLSVLFPLLDRKQRAPGFFIAVAGLLYGAFRLWRETLELSARFAPWVVVCIAGAAAGITIATTPDPRAADSG